MLIDIPAKLVPAAPIQSNIFVIAGGPCSGKTSILRALQTLHYKVAFEPAELLIKEALVAGKTASELRQDPLEWQQRVIEADLKLFAAIPLDQQIFVDTSLIETYVFAKRAGMEFGHHLLKYLKHLRFKAVFFLTPLQVHETTTVRLEDQKTALALSEEILEAYQFFGYQAHKIPPFSIEERVKLIMPLL